MSGGPKVTVTDDGLSITGLSEETISKLLGQAPPPYATTENGQRFGRILGDGVDIYLDVITSIARHHVTPLDGGRESLTLNLDVVAADVEPYAGAADGGKWEADHAAKTKDRITAAIGRPGLRVWTGNAYECTPDGPNDWALVEATMTGYPGTLRARLSFGWHETPALTEEEIARFMREAT